ncbi:MAG: glutathione transferase GstA [Acetobacteraceae bacterium]
MKLYYSPGACSLAAHIVAREAGLPVAIEKVDLASKKTESGADFAAINPKGYVPALALDDGEVLTEVAAVVQFLADQAPGAGLAPAAGTMGRARLQEWLNFIATELHKGFSPLWNPAAPAEMKEIARQGLARRLGYLDGVLAGREHLLSGGFSVADAYAFTILSWGGYVGLDLAPYPAIVGYMARVGGRPGVRAALREEGLVP